MKRWLLLVMVLLWLGGWQTVSAQESPSYRIVGYFASWDIYARGYFVTDIPAEHLTHINYAFVNISEDGECALGDPWADVEYSYPDDTDADPVRGNFHQLQLLKAAHPHLKVLLAVGGWTWSGRFSDVALTDESRARFAASCVTMMSQYGFDGLDIDWEYPGGGGLETNVSRPEDGHNYTLLLAELRRQLDAQGEADGGAHYLLTIAAPAGASNYRNMELGQIHESLDWINLMAYDFFGGWSSVTGLHAALYTPPGAPAGTISADMAVQAYLAAGVPADKLVLGVPFYGRGWRGTRDQNDGLFQPYEDSAGEEGSFRYRDLSLFLKTMPRHWDADAQAAWLYLPGNGLMISYDDAETLRAKAQYIIDQGLGGAMFWELGGDDDEHTLLSALHLALNGS
ncbi:MAG: glycoside hydrolase family 18 protein [Anaerolineae bacterium]|nr:glycoside hydrolase family 18 protein [Anaerolineae bacterium]